MAGGQRDSDSDSRRSTRRCGTDALFDCVRTRIGNYGAQSICYTAIYPDRFRCGIGRGRAVLRRLLSTAVPTPGGVECLLSFQQHPLPRPAGAPRSAARGKLQSRGEAWKRRVFGWLIIAAGGSFFDLIVSSCFFINRRTTHHNTVSLRNLSRK